jgi:hypothetical protein
MIAVLLLPAIPIFALGGVIITCDTPLVCCWTWAAVWAYRAVLRDDLRAWIAAGVIGALGVLAKYSCLAFPASVGLFLLLSPPHRRQLARPGFWMMTLVTVVLGLAPILVWNAQHGWAGAGQLADRVGLSSRARWASIWPVLRFLGGEPLALGVFWWVPGFTALCGAIAAVARVNLGGPYVEIARRPKGGTTDHAGRTYLLCLWGVIWIACLFASLLGETELNWMAPGYVALVVLIAMRVQWLFARGGLAAWACVASWCLSITIVAAFHHTDWFYPALARSDLPTTKRMAAPLRLYDPTARMRGHQVLARAVADRIAALKVQGSSPFVLTPTYALTSTLSFYLPGQPETYCLSWNFGMTPQPVNQHDLWHPNPRHDPDAFRRRAAVVVEDANMPPCVAKHMVGKGVFGRLESTERLVARERGVIVGAWDISICHDYQGIAGYHQSRLVR